MTTLSEASDNLKEMFAEQTAWTAEHRIKWSLGNKPEKCPTCDGVLSYDFQERPFCRICKPPKPTDMRFWMPPRMAD